MALRKIQRTGGGTFFVSLPKEWAGRLGLKRGSFVSVVESAEGRLVVDPKYDAERVPQVASLEPSEVLDRDIIGKYLLGFDVIRIVSKDQISTGQREIVRQAVRRLVGLEIIEEDYKSIVMQCLLEPASLSPEKILRREYNFAAGMHRDAVTALIEGDVHLGGNVAERDDEVNRLYFLLVRTLRTALRDSRLSERLRMSPLDCLDYRLVASFVEGIGDQSVQIAETLPSLKGTKLRGGLSEALRRLHFTVFDTHEGALKALFEHKVGLAESIRNKRDEIKKLTREVEGQAKSEQDVNIVGVVVSAAASLGKIYELGVDIADLVMPELTV
jgi:phosphate uptake regulator